jgi:hypothetical protein
MKLEPGDLFFRSARGAIVRVEKAPVDPPHGNVVWVRAKAGERWLGAAHFHRCYRRIPMGITVVRAGR